MGEWGWRIPFWVSIIIAAAGLYLRRNLTDVYQPSEDKTVPIVAILRHHRSEFWRFLSVASAIWIFYYTVFVYLPIWLEGSAGLSKAESGQINTMSIIVGVIFIPLMAMVADKIGSFRVMRIAALGLAIGIYPLMVGMSIGGYWASLAGTIVMVIFLCAFQAPIFASTVMALEYHGYRSSFTAVILGSAAGIVGGITPALMTSLERLSGDPYAPASLIAATSLIGWMVLRRVPA